MGGKREISVGKRQVSSEDSIIGWYASCVKKVKNRNMQREL